MPAKSDCAQNHKFGARSKPVFSPDQVRGRLFAGRALTWRSLAFVAVALLFAPGLRDVRAQTEAEFYRGKDVRVLISHPPGGGYDTYARLFARYLSRHLPGNPTVIAQNMPGAAGVVMANYLFTQAPRDGTVIGLGPGSMGTAALFGAPGARFDARQFTWIGSMNSEVAVAVSWHISAVKKAEDLYAHELIVGAAGATDQSNIYPNAVNRILGTKFKVIPGYRGSAENALALERGEVAGIGGINFSSIQATRPDWIKDAKVNVLLQLSLQRHPALPNVPTVLELGRSEAEKAVLRLVFAQSQMGRAIFGPPGIPPERAQILRSAFKAVLDDPEFVADATKRSIEINQPMSGQEMGQLIGMLHATSPELIKRASDAIAVSGAAQ